MINPIIYLIKRNFIILSKLKLYQMKKIQVPFLQKFIGKTTKIPKNGIISLLQTKQFLDNNNQSNPKSHHPEFKQRPSSLLSSYLVYRDSNKATNSDNYNKYQQQVNLDSIIPDPMKLKQTNKIKRDSQLRSSSNTANIKKIQYIPSFIDESKSVTNSNTHSRLNKNEVSYGSSRRFVTAKDKVERQLVQKNKKEYVGMKRESEIYERIGGFIEDKNLKKDVADHFEFLSSIQNKIRKKE